MGDEATVIIQMVMNIWEAANEANLHI